MELRVLGLVEASVDGRPVDLGAPRQRCVLAVLALEPNRVVPVDRLIDAVWDTDLPATPKTSVWSYVSRLRKAFADVDGVSLARRTGGYRLDITPEAVDLHRFRALLAQARATPDLAEADRTFRAALALWRGAPLGDVRTSWLEQRVCAGLEQEYLDAVEDQYACRLRLGAHAESVPVLRGIAAEHPRREKLTGLLMLALYRGGQKAAALDAYHRTAHHIAADLGLDPGAELRQLHEAVLRDDPALADPSQAEPTTQSTPTSTIDIDPRPASTMDQKPLSVVPDQLPGDIAAFTGRQDELARLDALHRDDSGNGGPATRGMRITAITGTAGVGKTSLALHWGHRAAHQFPDGTLYLDLRGFDDQQPPVEPADALRQLLVSLGVSDKNIPAGLDKRAALFRSLLANRRALVVLDNARGSKQVRPLLPGTSGCPVVVTSRTRLDGLVALDGARQIDLDSLAPHESGELLAALLGTARIEAEPEAAQALAARCGHLPLALRLACAQLGAQEHRAIADFVDVLTDHRDRLGTLDLLDLGTPLRTTFDVSYRSLSADAAQVFRVLGLHPGPDVGVHVVAAATGTRTTRIRRWLDQLVAAHLVTEHPRGRYAMHDLLRAYALEKATDLPLPDQARTTERILDYYHARTRCHARRSLRGGLVAEQSHLGAQPIRAVCRGRGDREPSADLHLPGRRPVELGQHQEPPVQQLPADG